MTLFPRVAPSDTRNVSPGGFTGETMLHEQGEMPTGVLPLLGRGLDGGVDARGRQRRGGLDWARGPDWSDAHPGADAYASAVLHTNGRHRAAYPVEELSRLFLTSSFGAGFWSSYSNRRRRWSSRGLQQAA